LDVEAVYFGIHPSRGSEGAREETTITVCKCLLRREEALLHHVAHHGVISGERLKGAGTEAVGAGITDMTDMYAVSVQEDQDARGSHAACPSSALRLTIDHAIGFAQCAE